MTGERPGDLPFTSLCVPFPSPDREQGLGLVTLFYPMSRVERMERDETMGGIEGIADRFRRETGRSILDAAGLSSRRRRR